MLSADTSKAAPQMPVGVSGAVSDRPSGRWAWITPIILTQGPTAPTYSTTQTNDTTCAGSWSMTRKTIGASRLSEIVLPGGGAVPLNRRPGGWNGGGSGSFDAVTPTTVAAPTATTAAAPAIFSPLFERARS